MSFGNQIYINFCKIDDLGVFWILVIFYGLNYYGIYEDYVIIDNWVFLYFVLIYIGVRWLIKNKFIKVYLIFFDNCGWICIVECLVLGLKFLCYVICLGVIEIDCKGLKGYGVMYDDVVLMYYNFKKFGGCLVLNEVLVLVVFYCRKVNNWMYIFNVYK